MNQTLKEFLQRKKAIFQEELVLLKNKGYITEDDFERINQAYMQYYTEETIKSKPSANNHSVKEEKKAKKPIKVKKSLTSEQIRERNITWSLILGVIFLLIGGLVVATNNWEVMNPMMKVISIAFVSILFFIISWFTNKFLKIEKTAFAFLILGSLFIPITVLSIGFFRLLGDWLSIYGEGKYLLGWIGSIISLPVYIRNAITYRSRLFIWLSYLFTSLGVGFFLKTIYLPIDAFYLGIILFNGILLFAYYKLKVKDKFALFTKELPVFSQLNLIISTLLMLFFFKSHIFYSINVLVTAILYISMVFVYKTKEYHFVFTGLLVYGIYQLIENTPLESIDIVLFSLVGFLYLFFQRYVEKENVLKKIFKYTSGVVSFFAFLYISYEGILLKADYPSLLMLLSYLFIALNYTLLSYLTTFRLFTYLSPAFLLAAGYEGWTLFRFDFGQEYLALYLYLYSTIMFITLYDQNRWKYLQPIKETTFQLSVLTMTASMVYALWLESWMILAILLFAFTAIAYLAKRHPSNYIKVSAEWTFPVAIALGLITTYQIGIEFFTWYETYLHIPFHLAATGLILLGLHILLNDDHLKRNTFYLSEAIYTAALIYALADHQIDEVLIRPLLFFIGIGMYILLVRKIKITAFWSLVSISTLAFYLNLIKTLEFSPYEVNTATFLFFGPLLLLLIYEFIGRKTAEMKPYFFWTAHAFMPVAILVGVFDYIFASLHPLIFLVPLLLYIYSTWKQTKEIQIRLFLYFTFTSFLLLITLFYDYFNLPYQTVYILFLSSIGIGLFWEFSQQEWKRRTDWYLIPLSIVGLIAYLLFTDIFTVTEVFVFLSYAIYTLRLLHVRRWHVIRFIPILLTIFMWFVYFDSFVMKDRLIITLFTAMFFIHRIAGGLLYKYLYQRNGNIPIIDWYSIGSFLYILLQYLYLHLTDPLWVKLIPAILLVFFFYSLINRVDNPLFNNIIKTLTVVSVLIPYYTILRNIPILNYIETELYVLPWIIMTIFLSKNVWGPYKKTMNQLQLLILIIVSVILIIDGLRSNTIYEAIIIGILSLLSILGGMHYRKKAYFFVGTGVLLLNLLLQTKPFWGNMPWWGYLLIAGATLIGFASFYEWQKQKKEKDGTSLIQAQKKKIREKFKEWD